MKKYKFKKNLSLVFVGVFSGIINGLFGTGAGLILVPLLKSVSTLEDKKIHATTLASVFLMCVSGLAVYFVKNQIDFSLAIWCAVGSVIGAIIGIFLLQKLKNNVIDFIFSGLLIVAGFVMICL